MCALLNCYTCDAMCVALERVKFDSSMFCAFIDARLFLSWLVVVLSLCSSLVTVIVVSLCFQPNVIVTVDLYIKYNYLPVEHCISLGEEKGGSPIF